MSESEIALRNRITELTNYNRQLREENRTLHTCLSVVALAIFGMAFCLVLTGGLT